VQKLIHSQKDMDDPFVVSPRPLAAGGREPLPAT